MGFIYSFPVASTVRIHVGAGIEKGVRLLVYRDIETAKERQKKTEGIGSNLAYKRVEREIESLKGSVKRKRRE